MEVLQVWALFRFDDGWSLLVGPYRKLITQTRMNRLLIGQRIPITMERIRKVVNSVVQLLLATRLGKVGAVFGMEVHLVFVG